MQSKLFNNSKIVGIENSTIRIGILTMFLWYAKSQYIPKYFWMNELNW